MGGESNYIHEDEIWRQRLKNETEGAAVWHSNWGFLTGREQPEARGFSSNVAKYAYGQGQWTVMHVRVPDNTPEGLSAAQSEVDARKTMSKLTWQTQPVNPTKPCENKGITLVKSETSGVQSREAAMLMRSHKFQTLGDACLTEGLDPGVKYKAPILNSHDYGWRAPSSSNNRKTLEMFGVAEHGRKAVVKKFD
uniref:Uncharacterized protein n=1 Tax=Haptolina brevifila TaxID=156173 RepID=A0A7S2BQZ5_9EUKA|mmetsp:Transcript_15667/g.31527  ORF Transcript_15667/g.31527 Transcript_15667/m.31527 type:complete len:194 (+) Transcript_15667:106-687(+)